MSGSQGGDDPEVQTFLELRESFACLSGLDEFHRFHQLRARDWPHALNATSTHDSKRGEDVRARLNVLSEMPERWRHAVTRWARMNERHRQLCDNVLAPDRNDEYLLYQTLVGTLPSRARRP